MPNLIMVLNEQIRRLARREVNVSLKSTRRATAHYRRDIAALKRIVGSLVRQVQGLRKSAPEDTLTPPPELVQKARLRVDGLRAHRARLGLTAQQYGKLFGVSSLTIYNWENGKAKPRRRLLPRLVAVRGLGKREAYERLGLNNAESSGPGKGGARRIRGKFKRTGEQAILAAVQSGKELTTRQINVAWRGEGRAGTADVLLGRLVKARRLRRTKLKGERGSSYKLIK